MARVVVDNLSKVFRGPKGAEIRAVNQLSFTIEDQELLVLVGPSGCGKTTTLRLIAGLEEMTHGTISIDGREVTDLPPENRDVAMVFQNFALYPHMTVHENMAFGLTLRKFSRTEIGRRVGEAAEMLGLTSCLERKPEALSGGERQRVAVGRAIVRRPALFLFDEPLSNLDAPMRAQMRAEIARLHARLRATMLYVTHDQAEAMRLGQRIAVMKEGMIQQVAGPMAVYRDPANLFVAGFIGSPPMNFFSGVVVARDGRLCFDEQTGASGACSFSVPIDATRWEASLRARVGRNVVLGVRPEQIREASTDSRAEITADLTLVEPMGAETFLHFATAAHTFVARVPPGRNPNANQKIRLNFEMDQARFFDPATGAAIEQEPGAGGEFPRAGSGPLR